MRLYLAGNESRLKRTENGPYAFRAPQNTFELVSYFYVKGNEELLMERLLQETKLDNILIDSGAFTYKNNKKFSDIAQYCKEYCAFINRYDIKYFFDLDIDKSLQEYSNTLKLRDYIEDKTGKQCVPVYHLHRGLDDFYNLVENYRYIAIGSIAVKGVFNFDNYKKLIAYANKHNCKVHGLGFNRIPLLEDSGFYSVDATTWNLSRYGGLWNWDEIKKHPVKVDKGKDKRIKSEMQAQCYRHNYLVWCKYQQYMKNKGFWKE